jgi:hypothetical protein
MFSVMSLPWVNRWFYSLQRSQKHGAQCRLTWKQALHTNHCDIVLSRVLEALPVALFWTNKIFAKILDYAWTAAKKTIPKMILCPLLPYLIWMLGYLENSCWNRIGYTKAFGQVIPVKKKGKKQAPQQDSILTESSRPLKKSSFG